MKITVTLSPTVSTKKLFSVSWNFDTKYCFPYVNNLFGGSLWFEEIAHLHCTGGTIYLVSGCKFSHALRLRLLPLAPLSARFPEMTSGFIVPMYFLHEITHKSCAPGRRQNRSQCTLWQTPFQRLRARRTASRAPVKSPYLSMR